MDSRAVLAQVDQMLESEVFRGNPTSWRLRALAEHELAHHTELTWQGLDQLFFKSRRVKPRVAGVDQEESRSSRVRGAMRYLLRRLDAYSTSQDASRDEFTIRLVKNSYRLHIFPKTSQQKVRALTDQERRLVRRAKAYLGIGGLRQAQMAIDVHTELATTHGASPLGAANLMFIWMALTPLKHISFTDIIDKYDALRDTLAAAYVRFEYEPWEFAFADASILACKHHRWPEALARMRVAVARSAGEADSYWWYAALLACVGEFVGATRALERSIDHLDHRNIWIRCQLATIYAMQGKFSSAESLLKDTGDIADPGDGVLASAWLLVIEAQGGSDLGNNQWLNEWFRLLDTKGIPNWDPLFNGLMSLVTPVREINERTLAGLIERRERSTVAALEIALVCVSLDRYDEAVAWLRRGAFEDYDSKALWYHIFPPLRHLRGHEGYDALLEELKLR